MSQTQSSSSGPSRAFAGFFMRELADFQRLVLENSKGRFYVGHADDIERRLMEHNSPEPGTDKYTHKNGPWNLFGDASYVCQLDINAVDRLHPESLLSLRPFC